jgi:hypothetical protein
MQLTNDSRTWFDRKSLMKLLEVVLSFSNLSKMLESCVPEWDIAEKIT